VASGTGTSFRLFSPASLPVVVQNTIPGAYYNTNSGGFFSLPHGVYSITVSCFAYNYGANVSPQYYLTAYFPSSNVQWNAETYGATVQQYNTATGFDQFCQNINEFIYTDLVEGLGFYVYTGFNYSVGITLAWGHIKIQQISVPSIANSLSGPMVLRETGLNRPGVTIDDSYISVTNVESGAKSVSIVD